MKKDLDKRTETRTGRAAALIVTGLACELSACLMPANLVAASQKAPWSLFCSSQIHQSSDCALTQGVGDVLREVYAKVAFTFKQDGQLNMAVNTSMIFGEKKQLSWLVDGDQIGVIPAACSTTQCAASINIEPSVEATIRNGKTLTLQIKVSENEGRGIDLELDGLPAALAQMRRRAFASLEVMPRSLQIQPVNTR